MFKAKDVPSAHAFANASLKPMTLWMCQSATLGCQAGLLLWKCARVLAEKMPFRYEAYVNNQHENAEAKCFIVEKNQDDFFHIIT